jgi:hypothetical protein
MKSQGAGQHSLSLNAAEQAAVCSLGGVCTSSCEQQRLLRLQQVAIQAPVIDNACCCCCCCCCQHPIHYSNVMLLDPEKNTPVRVSIQYEDQPPYRRVRAWSGYRQQQQQQQECVVLPTGCALCIQKPGLSHCWFDEESGCQLLGRRV